MTVRACEICGYKWLPKHDAENCPACRENPFLKPYLGKIIPVDGPNVVVTTTQRMETAELIQLLIGLLQNYRKESAEDLLNLTVEELKRRVQG